jgi:hypothetical protein
MKVGCGFEFKNEVILTYVVLICIGAIGGIKKMNTYKILHTGMV